MYRPVKDLNGIPGAKSLVACLTGYHGQDRDDVMVCFSYFIYFYSPFVLCPCIYDCWQQPWNSCFMSARFLVMGFFS